MSYLSGGTKAALKGKKSMAMMGKSMQLCSEILCTSYQRSNVVSCLLVLSLVSETVKIFNVTIHDRRSHQGSNHRHIIHMALLTDTHIKAVKALLVLKIFFKRTIYTSSRLRNSQTHLIYSNFTACLSLGSKWQYSSNRSSNDRTPKSQYSQFIYLLFSWCSTQ